MWIAERRKQPLGICETEFYGERLVTEGKEIGNGVIEKHVLGLFDAHSKTANIPKGWKMVARGKRGAPPLVTVDVKRKHPEGVLEECRDLLAPLQGATSVNG